MGPAHPSVSSSKIPVPRIHSLHAPRPEQSFLIPSNDILLEAMSDLVESLGRYSGAADSEKDKEVGRLKNELCRRMANLAAFLDL